jgi:hypothetical protein
MTPVPAVVSPLFFLLTLPFLLFYVPAAKRVTERLAGNAGNNARLRRESVFLLVSGGVYIALALLLLLPVTQAGSQSIGWFFAWFCAHGWPALLIARVCRLLWRAAHEPEAKR